VILGDGDAGGMLLRRHRHSCAALNCKLSVYRPGKNEHQKVILVVDDRIERPVVPRVSPYLRPPLRMLKEAERDNGASG
jgi:hypothetical protein